MTAWHVPGDVLATFATDPIALDDVTAASVESHVTRCGACRSAVAAEADPVVLERSWQAVVDAVDRPRSGLFERVLGRLLSNETARLVAATPALRAVWLAAVAAVIAGAVLLSRTTGSPAPFLVVAPLVPLVGVAGAFRPDMEPGGEAAAAAPLATGGLLLRRAQAVLTASLALLGTASVALPGVEWQAAAWLLPALFLTLASLSMSTWIAPRHAVAVAASAWLGVLLLVSVAGRSVRPVADSALFAAPGQVAFAALTAAAAVALVSRRHHLVCLEVR
ncbi:MAG TPA: hypothetical protein VHM89_01395 [Acidimicrobiales bacterium]|nr:hypothetical protein [Acidimicrobiales bacterium]